MSDREPEKLGPTEIVPGLYAIGPIPVIMANVNCPKCDSPPSEHEVHNHSAVWHDGDVYCKRCGSYVRMFDAG